MHKLSRSTYLGASHLDEPEQKTIMSDQSRRKLKDDFWITPTPGAIHINSRSHVYVCLPKNVGAPETKLRIVKVPVDKIIATYLRGEVDLWRAMKEQFRTQGKPGKLEMR